MRQAELDSFAAFQQAWCGTVSLALEQRCRILALVDDDFDGWPLDLAPLLADLTSFARMPGRRVVLIARRFDRLPRRSPRFTAWRRTWDHAVAALAPAEGDLTRLPSACHADGRVGFQIIDRAHWRGRVLDGEPRLRLFAGEIDALVQRCEPSFPASTLGI